MQKPSCTVCFEDLGKKIVPVVCGFCSEDLKDRPCMDCTKEYMMNSTQEAHCMACRHVWGYAFLAETFPNAWLIGAYRKNRQEKSLEREKSLLPQTLPLVELEKQKNEMRKEIAARNEIIAALRARIADLEAENRVQFDFNHDGKVKSAKESAKQSIYTFPCPQKDCRGFIEGKSWTCGLCDSKICNKCHQNKSDVPKGKKNELTHVCKKEDIQTAAMIMKETKPCPKCSARIFKIDGCDQMFCTQCQTAFSWRTGKIEAGVVHNPHYYELMRQRGTVPRNPGDVPCGGLVDAHRLRLVLAVKSDFLFARVMEAHRQVAEIGQTLARERQKIAGRLDLSDLRLDFLMKRIQTEDKFKKSIFLRERMNQKKGEELQILETFQTACIGFFNQLVTTGDEIQDEMDETHPAGPPNRGLVPQPRKQKVSLKVLNDWERPFIKRKKDAIDLLLKNINQVIDFCNKAFVDNFKALGYKCFPRIEIGVHYPANSRKARGPTAIQPINRTLRPLTDDSDYSYSDSDD